MIKNMKKIITIILWIVGLLVFLFIVLILWDRMTAPKNHTSDMKEVLNPMQKKLGSFYKKEKRFPTVAERNKLLEESNCKVIDNKCEYNGNKFLIISETSNLGYYILELKLGYSRCDISLYDDGDVRNVSCIQDSKYDIGQ